MRLPTKAEYNAATPYAKGYMAYTFSAWPKSEIPPESNCPYPGDSEEYCEFQSGVQSAILDAQDSES